MSPYILMHNSGCFLLLILIIIDIMECDGTHDCSQICVNTIGSYYCNCEKGYERNGSTDCIGEILQTLIIMNALYNVLQHYKSL